MLLRLPFEGDKEAARGDKWGKEWQIYRLEYHTHDNLSSKFNECKTIQIVPPEIGPITIPGLDKVEKTTNDNSEKLDELLRVVQNMTASSSETTGK